MFSITLLIGATGCKSTLDTDRASILADTNTDTDLDALTEPYRILLKDNGKRSRVERFRVDQVKLIRTVLKKNLLAEFSVRHYESTQRLWRKWTIRFECRQTTSLGSQVNAFSNDLASTKNLGILHDLDFEDCMNTVDHLKARLKHPENSATDILFSVSDSLEPLLIITTPQVSN